jgi:glycosyltransferase involved in cell wall biosynthesis
MRIVMLAQFYWPLAGTEERHVQHLSEALAARGHDVHVATLAAPGLAAQETVNGVHVHRISSATQRAAFLYRTPRTHAPPLPDPEVVGHLRRVVSSVQPDIVHGHNWLAHSFMPLKRKCGPKFVLSLHDHSLVCARKTLLRSDGPCDGPGLLKCLVCAREQFGLVKGALTVLAQRLMLDDVHDAVDLFLPASHDLALRDELVARELPFRVVPKFVADAARVTTTTSPTAMAARHGPAALDGEDMLKEMRLPPGECILFAGEMPRAKGVRVLIEAHRRLPDAPPLVIIGTGDGEVVDAIPGVFVLGQVRPEVEASLHNRALFVVAPSIGADTVGEALLEAMAAGLPVIASAVGAMPTLIEHGVHGLLTEPGSISGLVDAMRYLLDNRDDLQRMSMSARVRAADFAACHVVTQIEDAYLSLLA